MIFEMLTGQVPFGEHEEDPYSVYQKVLKDKLRFPTFVKEGPVRKLTEQLLNRNSAFRVGGSIDNLKRHPLLRSVNWDLLLSRRTKAPFTP